MSRSPTTPKSLSVVSLFAGCGGLDLGFRNEGFEIVYAYDADPAAVRCYTRNIGHRALIRDVTSDSFHREIEDIGHCDVVLGGFPCQGFSKAGPKREHDPRNRLFIEMRRAVERLRPSMFVAENVDGMSQNFGGAFLGRITADFAGIGYDVEHRILQATSFGVPQHRRRIFFVGTLKESAGRFSWPASTHDGKTRNGEFQIDEYEPFNTLWNRTVAPALPNPRTIQHAIGDLLELDDSIPDHRVTGAWPKEYEKVFAAIKEGQKLCNVRHAPTSVYTWQIPEVFGAVSEEERIVLETISKNRRHKKYGSVPNGNPLPSEVIESLSGQTNVRPLIQSLLQKKYVKRIGQGYDLSGAMFCSGLFKRPRWDEPAPTVLTVFDNPRYFLHPLRNRPFSVRECARLQGFPDTFIFCTEGDKSVTLKDAYRLIGNAVPPPLATHLARAARQLLSKKQNMTPTTVSA
jgi:DNA (cytosine-5)-methyltransferase 1